MTQQMLPPPKGNATHTVNGRVYAGTLGAAISTVPDHDAAMLQANGWTRVGTGIGTTAQRPLPNTTKAGDLWLDTTLGYMIVSDGVTWRSPSTGNAV